MTDQTLIHLCRTPPGAKGQIKPVTNDVQEVYKTDMPHNKVLLYGEQNYIYTLPKEKLPEWKKTGQLFSIVDVIMHDWDRHSLEVHQIDITTLPMEKALVRESYFISPENLQKHDLESDVRLDIAEKMIYHQLWRKMLESVVSWTDYQDDFQNPEVLLPFSIRVAEPIKIIRWPPELMHL